MGIRAFTFSPSLTGDFVRVGTDLYRGDSRWIPPFEDELLAQLSSGFGFYQTPGNRHMNLLAKAGNKVVGRISASVNRDLKDGDGQPVGAVGFFEAADDYAVAEDLLDTAIRWLREEQGMKRIWGPMNFDIWHGYRLMTRGFDRDPFYGEPYNPPSYPEFFERYGFAPKQHWNSIEIRGRTALEKLAEPGSAAFARLVDQGYRFETFERRHVRAALRRLHAVLGKAFSGFLGYTPVMAAEFERVFSPMRHAALPRLFRFAYDESQRLCGFAVALRDLSPAIRAMGGRKTWLAKSRFLYHRGRGNRILFHLIGKTPDERRKRNGLGSALLSRTLKAAVAQGHETVLVTLTVHGSPLRRLLREFAADEGRQYTLYELNR